MNERGPIDVFHGSTCHGEPPTHPDRLVSFRPLDPTNRPDPFKRYRGIEATPLPRALRRSALPAAEVLSGQRAPSQPLDRELLGTLLFLAAGVTRYAASPDGTRTWFRTAMSAGNLHPVEVYVVGREHGVQHYQPLEHALVPLRPPETAAALPPTALVLTGIPFRTSWKYGERGWRHLYWDAGTIVANLLAAADAHGVPARVLVGFPDAAVAQLVGVDGVEEFPLAVVVLGDGDDVDDLGDLEVPPLAPETAPIAPRVVRFPLLEEAQAAGVLDAAAISRWREAGATVAKPTSPSVEPPPASSFDPDDRVEDVILRRGSTRVFRIEPAPEPLLAWALPAACRAVPLDVAPGGTLIEHLVNVHAIEGHAEHAPRDDARQTGARLCLGQPLGGDSAYTVFHSADLDPLLDALGARGYRAAQLEAGIAAGRLTLNAVALGAGATGLTFYDRLVSRYFRTDAAPMLATAVGIPDTGPAPSGTPGDPARLRRYQQVMTRLSARFNR